MGAAFAEELARCPGATILAGVRDPDAYEPFPLPAGGADALRAVHVDLGSREAIEESVAGLAGERIDVLLNNAGLMTGGLLEEQDLDEIYPLFQVNLVGLIQLTRALLPPMVERGRGMIVNNASISGYAHFPSASTYAASKAGVVAFSEALRRELRGTGVGVLHLVTPGVKTEMLSATEETYGKHMDTSSWTSVPAEEWAEKVVGAIESGSGVLRPGGKIEFARLASRGPGILLDLISRQMFSRAPRD